MKAKVSAEDIPQTKTESSNDASPLQDNDVWMEALKKLAKTEPATFGLLKRERFLGARGTVFRVQVPQERKSFSFAKLKTQNTIDSISKVLSEAAGRPVTFEAVLEGSPEHQADVRQSIQVLADTVGRDLLQIDESED